MSITGALTKAPEHIAKMPLCFASEAQWDHMSTERNWCLPEGIISKNLRLGSFPLMKGRLTSAMLLPTCYVYIVYEIYATLTDVFRIRQNYAKNVNC